MPYNLPIFTLIPSEFPDIRPEIIRVLGNCSNRIFRKTVIGMDMISPGMPQTKPQSISITKIVITLMEKDFPMKIGSKIPPKST